MGSRREAFEFDVALSFAGEDRAYVYAVANGLRQRGIRVFYDEFMAADLWGTDLTVILDEVYRKKSRFVVAFVSRHYVTKPWTRHERRSAQARALDSPDPYLLPVRFDDSELPGIPPTVAHVDARHTSAEQLVALIMHKVADAPGTTAQTPAFAGVPRSPEQQRDLLAQRPPGWEFSLYAGVLQQREDLLTAKWYGYEIGYIGRPGRRLGDDSAAATFYAEAFAALVALEEDGGKLSESRFWELAFGTSDVPADPARIEHLAASLMAVYERLLDWVAEVRGVWAPDDWVGLFDATARLADKPLGAIRQYIDQAVVEASSASIQHIPGEKVKPAAFPGLEFDGDVTAEYRSEALKVREMVRNRR